MGAFSPKDPTRLSKIQEKGNRLCPGFCEHMSGERVLFYRFCKLVGRPTEDASWKDNGLCRSNTWTKALAPLGPIFRSLYPSCMG